MWVVIEYILHFRSKMNDGDDGRHKKAGGAVTCRSYFSIEVDFRGKLGGSWLLIGTMTFGNKDRLGTQMKDDSRLVF